MRPGGFVCQDGYSASGTHSFIRLDMKKTLKLKRKDVTLVQTGCVKHNIAPIVCTENLTRYIAICHIYAFKVRKGHC